MRSTPSTRPGAFPSRAEAEAVLEVWRREGRTEPLALNLLPVYETAAQWQEDR
jgi:hypothetical protein